MPLFVFLAAWIADYGFILGRTIQIYFAIRLGAGTPMVLLIGAAQGVAYTATTWWVAGPAVQRFGSRRLVHVAGACVAPIFLLTPLAPNYWWILLLSAATGPPMGLFWPSLHSRLVERADPQSVPHLQSLFNMVWTTAMLISFASSGWLFELGWFHGLGAWVGMGVAGVVSGALAFLPLPAGRLAPSDSSTDAFNAAATGVPLSPAGRRLFGLAGWVANFGSFFVFEAIRLVFPSLGRELDFPESLLGMLIAVANLAQLSAFFAMTRWRGWVYRRRYFYASCAVQGAALAAFCVVDRPAWFALGFAAIGSTLAFTYAASLLYSFGATETAGHAGGRHEAMIGSARVVAPVLGAGAAAALQSSRAPFAVYLVAVAIIAVLYARIFARLSPADRAAIGAGAATAPP